MPKQAMLPSSDMMRSKSGKAMARAMKTAVVRVRRRKRMRGADLEIGGEEMEVEEQELRESRRKSASRMVLIGRALWGELVRRRVHETW